MDTNSAVAEVPNFKLAKVGKERDRKRGGASWFGPRAGGFGGALGGAGAGSGAGAGYFAGLAVLKTALIALLVGAVAAGAWEFGAHVGGGQDASRPKDKKLFDSKAGSYADTSGVIKADNSIPNSLGYISGSTDGLTPEERAKKAAEEEAARKAAEDAQKKADEEAAAKDKADASKAAEAAPAPAPSSAGMPKLGQGKFGALSAGLGGGSHLSGGPGLSGGINGSFGGAAGLGDKFKGQGGSMASMRNARKASMSTASKRAAGPSKSKGFAKRQLDNAFAQSRQATAAGKGETAAENAGAAFDNNPGQGSVIAGPGVGNGAGAGSSDSGGSLNPGNSGGPVASTDPCSDSGMYVGPDGTCVNPNNGGGPKNDAPYQWMITLAEALLAIMMIFAVLCIACKGKAWAEFVSDYASIIIGVLGGIICALGAAIIAMTGDIMMGGIFAAVGGFCAATALFPNTLALGGNAAVNVAASALIASALGSLAGAMAPHQ